MRRIVVTFGLALFVLVLPASASAHPLGNFTVNRYAGIVLAPGQVRIDYVVDFAEIPTVQALPDVDLNGDGTVTDAERQAWATLPFNERKYKKDFGIPKLFGETGYTTLERTWARPTFEVNGLLSGFTGEGAKTVLPAVAMAKISMRLVPNQEPNKIAALFQQHIEDLAPKTVELKVTRMHGGKPWMTSFDNPYVQAAGRAIEKGFGRAPVFTREGGSIPVVSTFQEELGLPSVLFGVGLPDENAHAPNEKLDVGNFHNGIIASAILYEEIGNLK